MKTLNAFADVTSITTDQEFIVHKDHIYDTLDN